VVLFINGLTVWPMAPTFYWTWWSNYN